MSHFTPTVIYKTRFDDDEITVTLRRLKRGDLTKLAPLIQANSDDQGNVTVSGQLEILDLMTALLPTYVVTLKGLTIDGVEVEIKDIIDEVYFTNLLTDISTELFRISNLSGDEVKKSDRPHVASLKDANS